jgi:hypothetical protein
MFANQHRVLVDALREAGVADPEGELRRWQDEQHQGERQAEADFAAQAEIETFERDAAAYAAAAAERERGIIRKDWSGGTEEPGTLAEMIAEVIGSEVALVTRQLRSDFQREIHELRKQVCDLRTMLEKMRKAPS